MPRRKQKSLKIALAALVSDVEEFRGRMTSFEGVPSAKWAETARWLGSREKVWRQKQLISDGAFEHAVVLLSRHFMTDIPASGTVGSHLVAICHPEFERQKRSDWSKGINNVLNGKLTIDEAVRLGITATGKQTKRTAAAKAERELATRAEDSELDEIDMPLRPRRRVRNRMNVRPKPRPSQ